jgi:hypothetical protein
MCHAAPDHAFLLRRALVQPRVPWFQTAACGDGSKAAVADYNTAGIMSVEAITASVPEPSRLPHVRVTPVRCLTFLPLLTDWLTHVDWQPGPEPSIIVGVGCAWEVRTPSAAHDVFPNITQVG